MSIYFAPALISLLFKLIVLGYVLKGARVSIVFLSLIVVFALHNAIEISGYLYFENTDVDGTFLRLYYVATAYAILYMFLHGLAVSKLGSTRSTSILVAIATTLSAGLLFTDFIIAGQYSIGYSVSAVKGSFYWLFASYLLITLTCNVCVTFYGYRNAKSQMDSVRCFHSLLALAPIMLVFFLAIIFKITNVGINATGLVPLATALFLAIVLNTESKHKLSDLRRVMPLSTERETTNNLMDLLDDYIQNSNQDNVYKKLHEGIEKEIILYSLKKCDNNISVTAKMMGLKNRSTLYSMMNRLDINLNELKKQKPQQLEVGQPSLQKIDG